MVINMIFEIWALVMSGELSGFDIRINDGYSLSIDQRGVILEGRVDPVCGLNAKEAAHIANMTETGIHRWLKKNRPDLFVVNEPIIYKPGDLRPLAA